jgi:hypothetical protein
MHVPDDRIQRIRSPEPINPGDRVGDEAIAPVRAVGTVIVFPPYRAQQRSIDMRGMRERRREHASRPLPAISRPGGRASRSRGTQSV